MLIPQNPTLRSARHVWQIQDRALEKEGSRIQSRLKELHEGNPQERAELVALLGAFRGRLRSHFSSENKLNECFCQEFPPQHHDVMFVCRQSCSDQLLLIQLLDEIIHKLTESEGRRRIAGWTDLKDEITGFFLAMDDHEDCEAASIGYLCSAICGTQAGCPGDPSDNRCSEVNQGRAAS